MYKTMNSTKNILISGGAGFIGSRLALRLLEAGHRVTVLDNLSPQIHGENPEIDSPLFQSIQPKVEFIRGDVSVKADWLKAIEGQDCIYHLAAETGTGQSMYEIERYDKVNSYGTALLLDILVNQPNQVQKIVLASSRAIYGEGKYKNSKEEVVYPDLRLPENMKKGIFEVVDEKGEILSPLPTDENSKIHPVSIYGITKAYQEQIVEAACRAMNKDFTILRYQNVYGAGQSLKNPYTGILSVFSNLILNGKSLNLFEDAQPVRDFVYVDDVVEATIRAMDRKEANGQIINVGSGQETTVLQVAKTLAKAYGKELNYQISGEFRLGDIRYNLADQTNMKKYLDFMPSIGFEEGIKKFTTWVMQQEIEDNENFQQSLDEMKAKGMFLKS